MFRMTTATLALIILASGCSSAGDTPVSTSGPLRVVATTTIVSDFVRVIGGERVSVYGILKPNVDPHDYEPAPVDLEALRQARVIVKNGVGLEAWLDDTMSSSGSKATVVDASNGIDLHDKDPHIWHDPRNAMQMVATITNALVTADPGGASAYAQRRDAYLTELGTLDTEIAANIATLANKKLVTNHDAFGYFVARYGLEFVGSVIPSFDTSSELSATELRQLVAAIKAQGVKAVFSETSLPAKTAQSVADEAGVKVIAGPESLYGDGLGPADSDGATYLTMMRHNSRTIVSNLR